MNTGIYTVKARDGGGLGGLTDSMTLVITKVEVDKIQYKIGSGDYAYVPDPLVVAKGTTVDFKAIPSPSDASWPDGKPVWGGTSGASGTGETLPVPLTFNTLSTATSDFKTVTAECGNTVTVNILVFDFEGKLTPDQYFDQRSQERYGLEEKVRLEFTTTPEGISATQIGNLKWAYFGVGAISIAENDGTAWYDAGEAAGAITLRLTITSGPSLGKYKSYSKRVVAPSGAYMAKKPNSGIRHTINTCSVGFLGLAYLEPNDVSFSALRFREDTCTGTGTGFYAYLNGKPHDVGDWCNINPGNISTGCPVEFEDKVYSEDKGPPYSPGQFVWPIPWEYRTDDGVAHQLVIANHNQVADEAGKCTIQKNGAGPFSKNADDATSSW